MDFNIYYKYNFEYDKSLYMKNLKKELVNKGYTSLSLFYNLLESFGIHGYETAKSYYNCRRIIPLDLLIKLSERLKLNVTNIMFPNSILKISYNKEICNSHYNYSKTFDHFNTIFYIYNNKMHPDIVNLNDYNELKFAINELSLILLKYNYLLQKFYFTNLCKSEMDDLTIFSMNFIKNKTNNSKFDLNEFLSWKQQLKTNDFIKEFYSKYTLCFQNIECKYLLEEMKDDLPIEIYKEIDNLLPKFIKLRGVEND